MSFTPKNLDKVLIQEDVNSLTRLASSVIEAKNGFFGLIKTFLADNSGSIARKAKPLIFQFPVLVSDSIAMTSLTKVNKALEIQYASFIKLASGLETATSVKNADEARALLAKLHVNTDDPALEGILESAINTAEVERVHQELLTEFRPIYETKSIEDIYQFGGKYNFKQSISEARILGFNINRDKGDKPDPGDVEPPTIDVEIVEKRDEDGKEIRDPYISAVLKDSDVKKANNIQPTMMEISILIAGAEGKKELSLAKIIIGVKTMAHLVRSREVIENMISAIVENRFLFKLIKLTTGEISFIKDFILNLDKNKKEAIDTAKNKTSPWWRALKNRASNARFRNFFKFMKQLPPNATLILSMEEVEILKNKYDIDIFVKDRIKLYNVMQQYFLMSVVVVNEAAEVVYFFFDGNNDWQMHSFSELSKEKETNKELQKLLSVIVGRA